MCIGQLVAELTANGWHWDVSKVQALEQAKVPIDLRVEKWGLEAHTTSAMIRSLLAGLHTLTCVVSNVSSITFLLLLSHTIPTLHEQQRAMQTVYTHCQTEDMRLTVGNKYTFDGNM